MSVIGPRPFIARGLVALALLATAAGACAREPFVKREESVSVARTTAVEQARAVKPGGRPGGQGDCRAVRRDRVDSAKAAGGSSKAVADPCAAGRDSLTRADSTQ